MDISVIICTYNRSESLAKTLESIAASMLPESTGWEVLVADNNSKDQTRGVINEFCGRYPGRFRYVFEPRQGKSHALNTAIREAKGDILAFTDDDVTVEPAWLQNLTASLHGIEWAGTGGCILPPENVSLPAWLSRSMMGTLALLDRGPDACELTEAPFGANMAFRKSVFEKYGGFQTNLGPPPSEFRGEDTEFCERLMRAGERLRYEPSAIVHHAVPDDRLKQKYFLAWWFGYGRGVITLKGKQPPIWGIPRPFFSIPNRIINHLPAKTLRWLRASDPQLRFCYKCWVWMTAGEIVEIYRQLLGGKKEARSSDLERQSSVSRNT